MICNVINMKKGIAISIDMIIIVAFVIAVGVIVTSSFSTIFKVQTTQLESANKACTGATLNILSSGASSSGFFVNVQNTGQVVLSNFTMSAKKADGSLYSNATTAIATLSLAKGASAIITVNDINSTVGCPLSELIISAGGSCPISMKRDNFTTSIC